ncbi:MAG: threonine synthase [Candidatus Asgardarchaeia archaeon]
MKLRCTVCGREFSDDKKIWRCDCGGPLEIIFKDGDYNRIPSKQEIANRPKTMWRFQEFYPIRNSKNIITLGESITPLTRLNDENDKVLLKLDFLMPTLSFKDRGTAVLMSKIKELGIQEIVEDSSGNAGASIAAYAARAGIKCTIYVPYYTSGGKVSQIMLYGANLIKVEGSRDKTAERALVHAKNTYYASHYWNPYFLEGIKSFSYELSEQFNWSVPDFIILPIGSGSFFLGAYKGFKELYNIGWISEVPHLIGVQTECVKPVYNAFHGIKNANSNNKVTKTVAEGIAITKPIRIKSIVNAIKGSNGNVITVSENEIISALKQITKKGILIEPTSAVTLAAYTKLVNEGIIDKKDSVVIPLTGSGLKAYREIQEILVREYKGDSKEKS